MWISTYLTFAKDGYGLRLRVTGTENSPPEHRLSGTITQANLFLEAARICDLQAHKTQWYADCVDGIEVPARESQSWAERAALHRGHHENLCVAAAANLGATHHYAAFDAPYSGVQVAGVDVYTYVHPDGHLQISVHLEETVPWLIRDDSTVPMRITVQDGAVFGD